MRPMSRKSIEQDKEKRKESGRREFRQHTGALVDRGVKGANQHPYGEGHRVRAKFKMKKDRHLIATVERVDEPNKVQKIQIDFRLASDIAAFTVYRQGHKRKIEYGPIMTSLESVPRAIKALVDEYGI